MIFEKYGRGSESVKIDLLNTQLKKGFEYTPNLRNVLRFCLAKNQPISIFLIVISSESHEFKTFSYLLNHSHH